MNAQATPAAAACIATTLLRAWPHTGTSARWQESQAMQNTHGAASQAANASRRSFLFGQGTLTLGHPQEIRVWPATHVWPSIISGTVSLVNPQVLSRKCRPHHRASLQIS